SGITQIEVFASITENLNLDKKEIGRAMQTTSRILSQLAKSGILDDSDRLGAKHVYKIPVTPKAGRGTRTEALMAENTALKTKIKELEERCDFLCDKNDRLECEIIELKAKGN